MSYGFIYITTNKINGKKYLGMCAYHRSNSSVYLGSGKALRRAIKKYSRENFTRDIIFIGNTKEELSNKEIELINKFNCVESSDWYNIASGGYTTRGFAGKKHSEETKAKMRANHKQPLTEDSRRRMSEASKKRGFKNAVHYSGAKHGKSKSVIINDITYGSVLEAVRETGLSYHHIRKLAGLYVYKPRKLDIIS